MAPLLFVYGTLRSESPVPKARWLAGQGTRLGRARFTGRLYDAGRCPVLLDDPHGHTVHGEVLRLHRPAPALAALDRYEWAVPNDGRPRLYRRALVRVETPDVLALGAWTYLWTGAVGRFAPLLHGDYYHPAGR